VSYLLDTNVVSETRRPEPKVLRWLESSAPDALYVSMLTLGEVAQGHRAAAQARSACRCRARGVAEGSRGRFSDRIVPVDQEIAACWGRLSADAQLPVIDGLLAATAVVRGLTLVTRNTRDVARTGAAVVNPWD
jgi:predicted nucleic acid-binding protein